MRSLIVLLPLLLLAGCEKYALDRQMEELCKKDGGLTIYEKVKLPASRFDSNGEIIPIRPIHLNPEGRYGPEYKLITNRKILKKGDPVKGEGRLERTELTLMRVRDQKILAIAVRYSRIGGDFIAYSHFSSKACPGSDRNQSIESVFIKED